MTQERDCLKKIGGGTASSEKVRDSNIELFRIITMLLIVAHHFVVNSGLTAADGPIYADPLSWRSLFLLIFGAWGKTGINCFVLITGYFMCKSQITARKFAKLFFEVIFYRVLIWLIFWISGYELFTFKSAVMVFVPITKIATNFTSCFLLFYLSIPFLNALVLRLNEKQHIRLLLLSGFTYVVLGTVHRVTMNYVSWFIVLYFISSYIRLYPKKIFDNTKLLGALTLTSVFLSVVSVVACAWLGTIIHKNKAFFFVTDSNTFLAVCTGICSFLFFKNHKLKYSSLVNMVSASTFGVFLIHSHSDAMRRWLWRDILDNVGHYRSSYMPLYAIGSVIAIFIFCTLIDQGRIQLLEKPFFKFWDKHWDYFRSKFARTEYKILSGLGIRE